MPWEDPTPSTPATLEDYRYQGRRSIAFGSFYFMVICTAVMLLYGMFWPNGPATLVSMNGVIVLLYGSFTAIVAGYMGLDAFELHSVNSNKKTSATEEAA